jgi:hypothetical protein
MRRATRRALSAEEERQVRQFIARRFDALHCLREFSLPSLSYWHQRQSCTYVHHVILNGEATSRTTRWDTVRRSERGRKHGEWSCWSCLECYEHRLPDISSDEDQRYSEGHAELAAGVRQLLHTQLQRWWNAASRSDALFARGHRGNETAAGARVSGGTWRGAICYRASQLFSSPGARGRNWGHRRIPRRGRHQEGPRRLCIRRSEPADDAETRPRGNQPLHSRWPTGPHGGGNRRLVCFCPDVGRSYGCCRARCRSAGTTCSSNCSSNLARSTMRSARGSITSMPSALNLPKMSRRATTPSARAMTSPLRYVPGDSHGIAMSTGRKTWSSSASRKGCVRLASPGGKCSGVRSWRSRRCDRRAENRSIRREQDTSDIGEVAHIIGPANHPY